MTVAQTGRCRMPGGSPLRPAPDRFSVALAVLGLLSDVAEDQ
jgi:hypothetical protein